MSNEGWDEVNAQQALAICLASPGQVTCGYTTHVEGDCSYCGAVR